MGKNSLGNLKSNAATFVHFLILGIKGVILRQSLFEFIYVCCHEKSTTDLELNIS